MSRFCTGRGDICNKLHEERETIKRQREKFLYYTTPFDLFHEKKKKKRKTNYNLRMHTRILATLILIPSRLFIIIYPIIKMLNVYTWFTNVKTFFPFFTKTRYQTSCNTHGILLYYLYITTFISVFRSFRFSNVSNLLHFLSFK